VAQEHDGQILRDEYGEVPSASEIEAYFADEPDDVRDRHIKRNETRAARAISRIELAGGRDPSRARQLAQGAVVRGATNYGKIIDLLAMGGPGSPFGTLATNIQRASGGNATETMHEGGKALWEKTVGPYRPPNKRDTTGRMLDAAGAGIAELPLGLMSGGASRLGPVARTGMELLSSVGGEVAAEAADMMGGGPIVQTGAALAGGLAPAGIVGVARRTPGAIGDALETLGAVVSPAMKSRAGRRLARVMARDMIQEEDIPAAIGKMREEAVKATMGGTEAMPAQALSDFGDEAIYVEEVLARDSPGLRKASEVQRAWNVEQMIADYKAKWPDADPSEVGHYLTERLTRLGDEAAEARKGIGDVTGLPTDRVSDMYMDLTERNARTMRHQVPAKVHDEIGKRLEPTTTLNDLDDLSAFLTDAADEAMASGRKKGGALIGQIRDEITAIVDDTLSRATPEAQHIQALRRAKNLRRLQGELEDLTRTRSKAEIKEFGLTGLGPDRKYKNVVAQAFKDGREPEDAIRYIISKPDPAQSFSRLKYALGAESDAWNGVQHIVRDYVFGGSNKRVDAFATVLSDSIERGKTGPIAAALRNLASSRKLRDALVVVFDSPNAPKNIRQFLRRTLKLSRGPVGTGTLQFKTGSNLPRNSRRIARRAQRAMNRDIVEDFSNGAVRAAASRLAVMLGREQTAEEAVRLLDLAFRDNRTMIALFEELPAHKIEYLRGHVARLLPSRVGNLARAAAGPDLAAQYGPNQQGQQPRRSFQR
jgi:hypothetical protein